jgi:hypothetical protein
MKNSEILIPIRREETTSLAVTVDALIDQLLGDFTKFTKI